MNITSYSDTDIMRGSLPDIITLLEGAAAQNALGALANEARALPTAEERAEYFSAPWKAPRGYPKALSGKSRVEAWLALKGLSAMFNVRGKLISSDWEFKNQMMYSKHFYHDLIKAGVMSDMSIHENLMACFYGAVCEASEDQPGGTRDIAANLLHAHIPRSSLFTFTRNRERVVIWKPIAPLLSVGGIGESIGVHPGTPPVPATLVR